MRILAVIVAIILVASIFGRTRHALSIIASTILVAAIFLVYIIYLGLNALFLAPIGWLIGGKK